MSTKAHAERLSRALESTGLASPVNATFGEGRVAVLCRVAGSNEAKWAGLVRDILIASLDEAGEVHGWQSHICRNYFIKEVEEGDRKLVWGWNVSIHSKEMSLSLDMIVRVIKGEPIRTNRTNELQEFPLVGATVNRNTVVKGKGVHTIGNGDFHPARSK